MCTSILMSGKGAIFGRNMDLHYPLEKNVVITPRKYSFSFRKAGIIDDHYAIIGMAMARDNYPLYFEAANEHGLAASGLHFPSNAYYSPSFSDEKNNISPFELIPWILLRCKSVTEAEKLLDATHICRVDFSSEMPLSPLHWHIADKDRSIVFEVTKKGQLIYENPINVLTNNPPFDFHLQNLALHLNLENENRENVFAEKGIKPFSGGIGAVGLPGDFSSPSRFVKASFLLSCIEKNDLSSFFHILDSVAMVKGSIKVEERDDVTLYSSGIDLENLIYYYKTISNNRICAVRMNGTNLDGFELYSYEVDREQDILFKN